MTDGLLPLGNMGIREGGRFKTDPFIYAVSNTLSLKTIRKLPEEPPIRSGIVRPKHFQLELFFGLKVQYGPIRIRARRRPRNS